MADYSVCEKQLNDILRRFQLETEERIAKTNQKFHDVLIEQMMLEDNNFKNCYRGKRVEDEWPNIYGGESVLLEITLELPYPIVTETYSNLPYLTILRSTNEAWIKNSFALKPFRNGYCVNGNILETHLQNLCGRVQIMTCESRKNQPFSEFPPEKFYSYRIYIKPVLRISSTEGTKMFSPSPANHFMFISVISPLNIVKYSLNNIEKAIILMKAMRLDDTHHLNIGNMFRSEINCQPKEFWEKPVIDILIHMAAKLDDLNWYVRSFVKQLQEFRQDTEYTEKLVNFFNVSN